MEEIYIPASGMAMEDVLLSEWVKQPGDEVHAGDVIAVVETDKSTVELSGETNGRLSRHLVAAGDRVRGGTTVAYLLAEGEVEPGGSSGPGAGADGAVAAPPAGASGPDQPGHVPAGSAGAAGNGAGQVGSVPSSPPTASAGSKDAEGRYRFSPRQRREMLLAGAGAGAGAVTSPTAAAQVSAVSPPAVAAAPAAPAGAAAPVVAAPQAAAAPTATAPPVATAPVVAASSPSEPQTAAPLPPTVQRPPADASDAAASNRRATAELVSESWRTVPHFSVGREVRAEGLLASLGRARAEGITATVTDFMLRALGLALEAAGEPADVGLAVATDWGVLIPVVRNVTGRSLTELASQRRAAVDRARRRRLGSQDSVAPFATLSNLGPDGVMWFTGVVPLGQTALLTVGQIGPRPAVEGRGLVVAQMFTAVLTADHRRYDGVDSARLLAGFVENLPQSGDATPGNAKPGN